MSQEVDALVAAFEEIPTPSPGDTVNLAAAQALIDWGNHPHVCSWGGELSSKFVPAYLAALADEVRRLREEKARIPIDA